MKKLVFLCVAMFLLLNFTSSYANNEGDKNFKEQYINIKESPLNFLRSWSKSYDIWYSVTTIWYTWQSRNFWWNNICFTTNPTTPDWKKVSSVFEVALYKDVFWPDTRLRTYYLDVNASKQTVRWSKTWSWKFYLFLKTRWKAERTYDNSTKIYDC